MQKAATSRQQVERTVRKEHSMIQVKGKVQKTTVSVSWFLKRSLACTETCMPLNKDVMSIFKDLSRADITAGKYAGNDSCCCGFHVDIFFLVVFFDLERGGDKVIRKIGWTFA
jgi:hypothetical protein